MRLLFIFPIRDKTTGNHWPTNYWMRFLSFYFSRSDGGLALWSSDSPLWLSHF